MSAPGSTVGEVSGRVGGLVVGDPDTWLGDVTHDSALAGPDVLFVAVKGATHDGHDFVRSAVAAGAPGGSEEFDPLERKIALFEHGTNQAAHGAGGADNRNRIEHGGIST